MIGFDILTKKNWIGQAAEPVWRWTCLHVVRDLCVENGNWEKGALEALTSFTSIAYSLAKRSYLMKTVSQSQILGQIYGAGCGTMQAYLQMSVCHAKNLDEVQACNKCENSDIHVNVTD